jgi:hypothetical protein
MSPSLRSISRLFYSLTVSLYAERELYDLVRNSIASRYFACGCANPVDVNTFSFLEELHSEHLLTESRKLDRGLEGVD